ncbi:hypothetical protein BDF20DRAFT_917780 [Mycotypha africana]|uniref:uncharacterized protein n=1 Tax=Mycotypha africana TaxID=64632 RepID=UPI0022FFFABC|nr:uncharacterized protein BDF20DRAFT_917780 [Mycotypha africana]KAI8967311.1 hypothetical protein BDF20DRAFT_917780 [Mycotypha africana]
MFFFGNARPILFLFSVCCCFFITTVTAQASTTNPFIWQILVEYDLSQSNTTKRYLTNTSSKVYSQEFQTIFENKDLFGYNERLVIDFGDGCSGTTIDEVEQLNSNWVTSPSMMSQPSIALVQRGGRCSPWQEKIATVQGLSDTYKLQVSGIVIYDNIFYNDTQWIQEDTNNASYPVWSSSSYASSPDGSGTLPAERNIHSMTQENSIDKGSTFVAVYYVPKAYMNYLNQTFLQQTHHLQGARQLYTQLTFFLSEKQFSSNGNDNTEDAAGSAYSSPSSSSSSSPSSTTTTDSIWNDEREKRSYVIYSVTGIATAVLIFVIARWCRAFARSSVSDIEMGHFYGYQQNLLLQDMHDTNEVILFDQLKKICPIIKYTEAKQNYNQLNTTCAICIDEFEDDSYVRVLPCRHGYCTACIDVWLTKKSSLCPICKYDCKKALTKEEEEEERGTNDCRVNEVHSNDSETTLHDNDTHLARNVLSEEEGINAQPLDRSEALAQPSTNDSVEGSNQQRKGGGS